jgi:hypothetical protein
MNASPSPAGDARALRHAKGRWQEIRQPSTFIHTLMNIFARDGAFATQRLLCTAAN